MKTSPRKTDENRAGRLLRQELSRRISANSRYSLRAFSKFLGLSPATVSMLISGRLPLSRKSAERISACLGLAPTARLDLLRQVATHKLVKVQALEPAPLEESETTSEIFTVLSEWHHFAILNLLEIPGARLERKWVSARLGIPLLIADAAIERLKSLGYVEKTGDQWRRAIPSVRVGREVSHAAARHYQRKLIEKAIEGLENLPTESRDITSMTFVMNAQDLAYASAKITDFRRSLTRDLESRSKPTQVCSLTIQLVPMTKE